MKLLKRFFNFLLSLLKWMFLNEAFLIMLVFVCSYALDPRPELGQMQVYAKLAQAAVAIYFSNWMIRKYIVNPNKDKKPASPENQENATVPEP